MRVHAGRTELLLAGAASAATRWAVQDLTMPLRAPDREVVCDLKADGGVLAWHAPIARNVGDPSAATDVLVAALTRMELDETPELLHLHAGAVEDGGSGVLIVGPREAGKTSLVFTLISSGARYLTDEMVSVSTDGTLSGYPKPLTLKGATENWTTLELEVSPTGRAALPASSVSDLAPETACHLIVLPKYDPTLRRCKAEPVHPRDALHVLVGETFDLRRYGPAALAVLSRLVGSVPVVRLGYSNRHEAVRALRAVRSSDYYPHSVAVDESEAGVNIWFDDGYGVFLDTACTQLRNLTHRSGGCGT